MNCFSKRRRRTWEKPFYAFSNDDRRTNQYRPIKESFQAEESVNFFGDEIMIPCAQWLRLSDAVQNGMEGGGELTKLINWFEAVADSTTLPVIEILQFDYKYQRDEAHLIQLFCDPRFFFHSSVTNGTEKSKILLANQPHSLSRTAIF